MLKVVNAATEDRPEPNPNNADEMAYAELIERNYKAAYLSKQALGLMELYPKCDDYWKGNINPPEDDDDPGSNINVIFPVVESQVSDLVRDPKDLLVEGVEPSDEVEAPTVRTVMEWFIRRNDMVAKYDEFERGRLKYGGYGWKVNYNPKGMKNRGFIEILPCNPANLFIDPKVKKFWQIQEADFIAHAQSKSLTWLRFRFGERAKAVRPQSVFAFDPGIYDGEDADQISAVVRDKALLIEYWTRDNEGNLRLTYMADGVILWDSEWDKEKQEKENKAIEEENARRRERNAKRTDDKAIEEYEEELKTKKYQGFYRMTKYPFVYVPCYATEGHMWGMGDVELLMPVQDLINDLDDQVRMNARLMGNIQIVVGMASGINLKKWTNTPGLKIPARDATAFKVVDPPNIPPMITERREIAKREAEMISGRPDVTEGRRQGSITAASAIIALQEAGSKRVTHKNLLMEWGMGKVVELMYEMYIEFFDTELAFRLTDPSEDQSSRFLWHRGTDLQNIVRYIPGIEQMDPITGQKYAELIPLVADDGTHMTKEAEFNFYFNIGAGLPRNKAFLYQASIELFNAGLLTREESRKFLKDNLGYPIIDPINPYGDHFNVNQMPGRMGTMGEQNMGMTSPRQADPMAQDPGMMTGGFDAQGLPPKLINMLGGMG